MVDPQERLDRLSARLAEVRAPLDDLARVRAEAQLEAALDAQEDAAAPPARARRGRRWWAAGGMLVAAAAVVLLALWATRPRAVAPALAVQAGAPAHFEPYVIAPVGAEVASDAVPPTLTAGARLDVPAGWQVRAAIGARVTVTAIGPATLTASGSADAPTIRLERGRLLVHGAARVRAPGVDAVAVGALFAVDAGEVSVVRGRVHVLGGERVLAPVDDALRAQLAEHEGILPPQGDTVPVILSGAPRAAEIWLGDRRVARTPAWLRLPGGARVQLSAPGFATASLVVPAAPPRTPVAYTLEPEPPAAPALAPVPAPSPARAPSPPTPAAAPPPTAAALYADADRALARGDHDGARAALLELRRRYPDDALAAAAAFDLATLALAAGELTAASRYLDGVDAPGLAEPRAYLACRIELARRSADAATCLAAFRGRYPASAHDADALAQLAVLVYDADGCTRARALLDEYARRYPDGPAAAALVTRRARCRDDEGR